MTCTWSTLSILPSEPRSRPAPQAHYQSPQVDHFPSGEWITFRAARPRGMDPVRLRGVGHLHAASHRVVVVGWACGSRVDWLWCEVVALTPKRVSAWKSRPAPLITALRTRSEYRGCSWSPGSGLGARVRQGWTTAQSRGASARYRGFGRMVCRNHVRLEFRSSTRRLTPNAKAPAGRPRSK